MVRVSGLYLRLDSENALLIVQALAQKYDGHCYDLVTACTGEPYSIKVVLPTLADSATFLHDLETLEADAEQTPKLVDSLVG